MAEITVIAHADNRGKAYHGKGKRQPLVQILIADYGDVHSISFRPEQAPEIAEAIARAGRAAKRGHSTKKYIDVIPEN